MIDSDDQRSDGLVSRTQFNKLEQEVSDIRLENAAFRKDLKLALSILGDLRSKKIMKEKGKY